MIVDYYFVYSQFWFFMFPFADCLLYRVQLVPEVKFIDQEWSEWLQEAVQVNVMDAVVRRQMEPESELSILLLYASLLA